MTFDDFDDKIFGEFQLPPWWQDKVTKGNLVFRIKKYMIPKQRIRQQKLKGKIVMECKNEYGYTYLTKTIKSKFIFHPENEFSLLPRGLFSKRYRIENVSIEERIKRINKYIDGFLYEKSPLIEVNKRLFVVKFDIASPCYGYRNVFIFIPYWWWDRGIKIIEYDKKDSFENIIQKLKEEE